MKEGGKNGAILLERERERERERQTRETVSTCCMAISVRYSWSTLSIASFRSFLSPYTPPHRTDTIVGMSYQQTLNYAYTLLKSLLVHFVLVKASEILSCYLLLSADHKLHNVPTHPEIMGTLNKHLQAYLFSLLHSVGVHTVAMQFLVSEHKQVF